ncbi:MAG TPA: hypothetical protein VF278_23140 [Pirellulales bacterium]
MEQAPRRARRGAFKIRCARAARGGGRWCEKAVREHHQAPFLAVNQRSTGVKPAVAERNKFHTEPRLVPRVKYTHFAQPRMGLM